MKKTVIILSCLITCLSCVGNFNPDTESGVKTLVLDVDCWSMLKETKAIISSEPLFMDGYIPNEYNENAAFRINAYCYDPDSGELINRTSVTTSQVKESVRLELSHIQKDRQHEVIVNGEMVEYDRNGFEEEGWYPSSISDINTFKVCHSGVWSNYLDIVGGWRGILKGTDEPHKIAIDGYGKHIQLTFLNTELFQEVHFGFKTLTEFKPEGDVISGNEVYYGYYHLDKPSIKTTTYIYYMSNNPDEFELKTAILDKPDSEYDLTDYIFDIKGMESAQITIDCLTGETSCIPWE